MRYPALLVLVLGGLALLGWWARGRRMPVTIHVTAAVAALLGVALLSWVMLSGRAVAPELWGVAVVLPVAVYLTYAFCRAFLMEEKPADIQPGHDAAAAAPALPAQDVWTPRGSGDLLTPDEKARAAELPVWRVWWQLPDKDWEAFCLSGEDAERLFHARQQDPLLGSWGRIGKHEPQMLLGWFEATTQRARPSDVEDHRRTLREILRRAGTAERAPLTIKTG